ncbi:MAG: hypothetical protein WCL14_04075 [Bacteroidota bacterium]
MKIAIKTFFLLIPILIGSSMYSCKHTPVIPTTPAISFSTQIMPIIVGNCTQSECHSPNGRHTKLGTYNEIMSRVVAYDASASRLYTDIQSYKMPKSPYPQMSDQQTAIIYLWIMQGALNN